MPLEQRMGRGWGRGPGCRRMSELSLIWRLSTESNVPSSRHVARSGDTHRWFEGCFWHQVGRGWGSYSPYMAWGTSHLEMYSAPNV